MTTTRRLGVLALVAVVSSFTTAAAQRQQQKYEGTLFDQTEVKGKVTFRRDESPYVVQEDVLVLPEGQVNVEPGVTIKFAPEVGFTVRGVFNADGGSNPKDKIR